MAGTKSEPAKQYVAVREWRRVDPRLGTPTDYQIGDPYTGPVDACQVSPEGPDGRGPVIAEKSTPAVSSDSEEK